MRHWNSSTRWSNGEMEYWSDGAQFSNTPLLLHLLHGDRVAGGLFAVSVVQEIAEFVLAGGAGSGESGASGGGTAGVSISKEAAVRGPQPIDSDPISGTASRGRGPANGDGPAHCHCCWGCGQSMSGGRADRDLVACRELYIATLPEVPELIFSGRGRRVDIGAASCRPARVLPPDV